MSTLSQTALSESVQGVFPAAAVMLNVALRRVVLPGTVAIDKLAGATATGGMRKLHSAPLTVLPSKFRVSTRQ